MEHHTPLEYDKYYHIYNRGNNSGNLFMEPSNYEHFIQLYSKYINPVAETFAWALMKNHFHFLVRIKGSEEIDFIKPREERENIVYPEKKQYNPTQQFGNLFNAYAKAFNKSYGRTGSLFETPFRRIPVNDEKYFRQLVFYIHNNPVHHGFCVRLSDYPWSSYRSLISGNPINVLRDKILEWFHSESEFIEFHQQIQSTKSIESMIIE